MSAHNSDEESSEIQQPQSVVDVAYKFLHKGIIDGTYEMNDRLVESTIASYLGVSRAPVRDAIRRLAEEGLVVIRPRRGAVVKGLIGAELVDLYNARIAIETMAMRLVAGSTEAADRLLPSMRQMYAAAVTDDFAGVVRGEITFHEELCRCSGNSFLVSMFQLLSAQLVLALTVDDAAYPTLNEVVAEHEPVIAAIRNGNVEDAVRVIEAHIIHSLQPVLSKMNRDARGLVVDGDDGRDRLPG